MCELAELNMRLHVYTYITCIQLKSINLISTVYIFKYIHIDITIV